MDVSEYIAQGEASFRAPSGEIDGYPSSPAHGAQLITWYLLYHTGRAPSAIATGRGYSFNVVDYIGRRYTARIVDHADHRDGVQLTAKGE